MSHVNPQKVKDAITNLQAYAKGQDCGDFFVRKAKKAETDHAGQIIKKERKARVAKQYKFTETIELQVGLKNYDPKKDPRFNQPLVLPLMPKTNTRILVLADAADCNRCQQDNVEYHAFDTLAQTFDKNKPGPIKRWAKKYDIILCSKSQIKNIVKVLGPTLTKINRQPLPLEPTDNLKVKLDEMKRTIRIQFKKVLGLNWPIGMATDKSEDVTRNCMMAINTLVDNLKKGW